MRGGGDGRARRGGGGSGPAATTFPRRSPGGRLAPGGHHLSDGPAFSTPLVLPCGARLPNRFLKSAMSEQLGDRRHDATPGLATLYRTWAEGGIGLQITGNVMVDRTALGEPGNVVLDDASDPRAMARWAEAGRTGGAQPWVQLNHPGRQSPAFLSRWPVAPSAVPMAGPLRAAFRAPRALGGDEIRGIIGRFARAAELARQAGFTGVQIHGAHGYLVSQFLSPRVNQRTDEWGGSAERRRRFVLEVYRAIRARVGPSFPVGIKLNSADFLRDGLRQEESVEAVAALAAEGIDLVEVSGGTYEAPAMVGDRVPESTRRREGYFLGFADLARQRVRVPLAVTGGFRSGAAMAEALRSGATDLVGLARPLALQPDLPARLLRDPTWVAHVPRPTTGLRALDRMVMLDVTYYECQLARLARGQAPRPDLGAWTAALSALWRFGMAGLRRRRG